MIFNPFWRSSARQQTVRSFAPGANLSFDQTSKTLIAASAPAFAPDPNATPGTPNAVGILVRTNIGTYALRSIDAGTGIDIANGDGVGGNITVILEDTAVTPGAYTNADITVDQQGRITAAASGSAGGGSWIPLVDGSEPPNFITDGAGKLITVFYTP